ncbi:50S ribosomal protein L13 [Clostridia bacterium]|nr:50S ribosomal protein L13 [Clostridia bacterium]
MRTTYITKASDITRSWYVVDAAGQTLGRLSAEVAKILRGKHKPIYSPFLDTGDYVIVINADKIKVTGKKLDQKIYKRHSDYVGGLKQTSLRDLLVKHPTDAVRHSIKGMLPKGSLGTKMYGKLKIYAGDTHEHQAQNPQPLVIKY